MADGHPLPSSDTVARYCFSDKLMNGCVSFKNFKLRPRDAGKLSTTWVECPHTRARDFSSAITRLPAPSSNRDGDLIVFLSISQVRNISGELGPLEVVGDGHARNQCHAAISKTGSVADPHLSSLLAQTELAALANRSIVCSPLKG